MEAHVCNPSTLRSRGRWITWGQEFQTSLTNIMKPHLYWNYKINLVWWFMPVIPALGEAKADGSLEVRSLRPAWPTRGNPISTKNTKICQARWHAPVVPATWAREAKAEELLEPRRWRLQWAKIVPLHTSLGDRGRLCLRKKIKFVSTSMESVLVGKVSVLESKSQMIITLASFTDSGLPWD